MKKSGPRLVVALALGKHVPDSSEDGVLGDDEGLFLPQRTKIRLYRAPR